MAVLPKSCISWSWRLGISSRNGDDNGSDLLTAIMDTQAAGKKPVTIGDLDDIMFMDPCTLHGAGNHFRPGIQILRVYPTTVGLPVVPDEA